MYRLFIIFFSFFVFAQNDKSLDFKNVLTNISKQNSSFKIFLQKKNLTKLNSLLMDSSEFTSVNVNSKESLIELAKNYAVLINVKKYAASILRDHNENRELSNIFNENYDNEISKAIRLINEKSPILSSSKLSEPSVAISDVDFKFFYSMLGICVVVCVWAAYRGNVSKKREMKYNKLITQECKSRLIIKVYENVKSENFFVATNNKIVYKSKKADNSIENVDDIFASYISSKEFDVVTKLGQTSEIAYYKKASIGSFDIYEIHKHVPENTTSKSLEYSSIRGLIPNDLTM